MAPAAPETEASLPRWDLSRFGFETPHHEGIDAHLEKTKRMAENIYICGDFIHSQEDGVLSPRVILAAAHQANMVLRLAAGILDP